MQLKDEAILLGSRKLLENKVIITALTKDNGVYSGVCNASSSKARQNLQIGNLIDFNWNARLEEHLGHVKCECIKSYGSIILPQRTKLLALTSITQLSQFCLHERHPCLEYYETLLAFLTHLAMQPLSWQKYFYLEMKLLSTSGYALDLSGCPVTGSHEELCYVSPKTGRSISKSAGEQYHDQLLKLPPFLLSNSNEPPPSDQEIKDAFKLCSYFFERYLYKDKPLPHSRSLLAQLASSRGTK